MEVPLATNDSGRRQVVSPCAALSSGQLFLVHYDLFARACAIHVCLDIFGSGHHTGKSLEEDGFSDVVAISFLAVNSRVFFGALLRFQFFKGASYAHPVCWRQQHRPGVILLPRRGESLGKC